MSQRDHGIGTPTHPRPAAWTAMERAIDRAVLAPSVHNTQPWLFVLHPHGLEVRADRKRQLRVIDPLGRGLVLSLGAAVFTLRVALAAQGWAADVDRLPRTDDPDLLALVRPVPRPADQALAALDPFVEQRRTNRRRLTGPPLPDDVLSRLAEVAAAAGIQLVPVPGEHQRRLVAQLTRQADRMQNADPAYRAELRTWTNRPPESGDGVPVGLVPHVTGEQLTGVPQRDFDTTGAGRLPVVTEQDDEETLILLATATDSPTDWLRCGEGLQHVLLELTRHGWVASPATQAFEVPQTRDDLRSVLTRPAHPQLLLRIGRAEPTAPAPRRRREDVVRNSTRPTLPPPPAPVPPPPQARRTSHHARRRPVSDGRGGTIWV